MATVLVIEDKDTLQQEILDILRFERFDILSAENAAQAIEQIKIAEPDVVLCDLTLSAISGYEILRVIRRDPRQKYIPFIFLSSKIDRSEIRQGMALGADDYIAEPFSPADLVASIQVQLEKHQNAVEFSEQKFTALRNHLMTALPHELRTPLTGILGFSEILMTDSPTLTSDEITDYANHINDSATRLWHVVENYLTYVQLELIGSGYDSQHILHSTLTPDAKLVIADHAAVLAHKAQRTGDLCFQFCEHRPVLCISEQYLNKIVGELVDNAFKFSEPGTPITISGHAERNCYLLEINNQGRGMTTEQIDNIAAYAQFDRKTYEQQGCGLGLVIAKRLVELHGGQLTIDSVPGQYLTVTVRLPLAEMMS